jgi:hypothetical protein
MFGTVISYDGTGITAGIHQAVAVFPKTLDQGPLWELLEECKDACPAGYMEFKKVALDPFGWELKDSKLMKNGKLVAGKEIRKVFNGSEGGVLPNSPEVQKTCEGIILAFHTFFKNPLTHSAQLAFGEKAFKDQLKKKLRFSNKYAIINLYELLPQILGYGEKDELSLALGLYLSNSVNAPGQALKELCKAIDGFDWDPKNVVHVGYFVKQLIYTLGNSTYGKWSYKIAGGRYQRTRDYAKKLWPKEYFEGDDAVMLEDITKVKVGLPKVGKPFLKVLPKMVKPVKKVKNEN